VGDPVVSLFVPIGADRICLALTVRTVVHASAQPPAALLTALSLSTVRPAFRTVCGSDAFIVAHAAHLRPGSGVAAEWPPPVDQRCTDCADLLGLGRREANGCYHWRSLVRTGGDQ
jgi:hypothetical protein